MRRSIVLLSVFLGACAADAATSDLSDEMPEDLPAGGCRDTDAAATSGGGTGGLEGCDAATSTGLATGSSSTTAEPDSECAGEGDCDGAGACVADWDDGERGPFRCQFACIPTLDETAWCSDDASCCDAAATCTPRGYCVIVTEAGGDSSTGA